jgi:hypothetical protein
MTYCSIISDKFRYCQLVNSDPAPCFFLDVCRMLFLCEGVLLNMYFTFYIKPLSCSIDILEIIWVSDLRENFQ